MSATEKKGLLGAVETVASWTGQPGDKLIDEYREAVLKSDFPGPDCLQPDESLLLVGGREIEPERFLHVKTCEACQELLEAAKPSEGYRRQFLEEVVRASEDSHDPYHEDSDPEEIDVFPFAPALSQTVKGVLENVQSLLARAERHLGNRPHHIHRPKREHLLKKGKKSEIYHEG